MKGGEWSEFELGRPSALTDMTPTSKAVIFAHWIFPFFELFLPRDQFEFHLITSCFVFCIIANIIKVNQISPAH